MVAPRKLSLFMLRIIDFETLLDLLIKTLGGDLPLAFLLSYEEALRLSESLRNSLSVSKILVEFKMSSGT